MAAEPYRHLPRRRSGIDAAVIELVERAFEGDVRLGPQRLHEAHLFGGALAAGAELHAQPLELDLVPADADAKAKAAFAERVEAGRLLGDQRRLALGQDDDAGGEADRLRDPGQEGEQHEGIVIGGGGGTDAPPAMVGRRVAAQHVVGREQIVEAQPFGRLRIVAQGSGSGADVTDGYGGAELHGVVSPCAFRARFLRSPLSPASPPRRGEEHEGGNYSAAAALAGFRSVEYLRCDRRVGLERAVEVEASRRSRGSPGRPPGRSGGCR